MGLHCSSVLFSPEMAGAQFTVIGVERGSLLYRRTQWLGPIRDRLMYTSISCLPSLNDAVSITKLAQILHVIKHNS
jgi:hypothetical protein